MKHLFNTCALRHRKTQLFKNGSSDLFLHGWVEDALQAKLSVLDPKAQLRIYKGYVCRGFVKNPLPVGVHSFAPLQQGLVDPLFLPFKIDSLYGFIDSMEMHLYNDVLGALYEIKRILKPTGLYLGAFLGGESAKALRTRLIELESLYYNQASLKLIPTIRPDTMTSLLQKVEFTDIVVECVQVKIDYTSLQKMVSDIRACGENKPFQDHFVQYQPKLWQHLKDEWSSLMPLPLDIIFITARA